MRKVILGVAVSLDGFIEGPNGEYDWCFTDQDYGMGDFFKRIDALFIGRKSYEVMATAAPPPGMESDPFAHFKKYIFSNTLTQIGEGYQLISGDIKPQVEVLKKSPGKDIWLFGGAALTTFFINEKLVDELSLAVHPILLGQGKPLFSGIQGRIPLTLIDSKTYSTGLAALTYKMA